MEEKQMIFKFKVLSVENDQFIRDYELQYDATLLDFHRLICEDLNFESEEMASFFLSNKNWDKLREFTLVDMVDEEDADIDDENAPMSMDKVTLLHLMRQKHERLIYVYDLLNDRGLYIELIETHRGKTNIDYPYVAFAQGNAPSQYGGESETEIFSEMMGDFEDEFDDKFDDDDDFKGDSMNDDFGGGFDDDYDDDDDFGGGRKSGGYGGGSYNDDYY